MGFISKQQVHVRTLLFRLYTCTYPPAVHVILEKFIKFEILRIVSGGGDRSFF